MSRLPHNPAAILPDPSTVAEGHALALAEEQQTKDIERDAAFDAARMLGQIEAFEFTRNIADLTQVQIFLNLKKNKAYRALTVKDDDGNVRRVADLDEFCERFLKRSYRRMQELASNYHLLGADLYEASERIGFRSQDYRALKALPADDQEVIKQAMSPEADRDQVLDLLQELAARHQSEKAALTAQAKEATETAEARSEVIARKETRINEQEEQIHKLRRRLAHATPDEVGKQLCEETAGIGWSVVGLVNVDLKRAFAALDEHAHANDCTHEEFMSGVLFEIERALAAIREDYAVKARPDGDARPDWTRPDFVPTPNPDTEAAIARFEKEHGYNPLKAGNA